MPLLGRRVFEDDELLQIDWSHQSLAFGVQLKNRSQEDWFALSQDDLMVIKGLLEAKLPDPKNKGHYLPAAIEASPVLMGFRDTLGAMIRWMECAKEDA